VDVIETVNMLMSKEGESANAAEKVITLTIRFSVTGRCGWADHDAGISEWNA